MKIARAKRDVCAVLRKNGDGQISGEMSRYFKNVVKFHGIKTPEVNEIFRGIQKQVLSELSVEEQVELAYGLFESEFAEEKRGAIEILIKNLKCLDHKHLDDFVEVIDKHVYDWGTCDGLAGKVICMMIKRDAAIAEGVRSWKDAPCLWRQRAACVTFVKIARFGKFNDLIMDIVESCVRNNERFVQLGVGWVLRELSLADLDRVCDFVKRNYAFLSREGLRYTIEKMNPQVKAELRAFKA